jgi:hypothetical protein
MAIMALGALFPSRREIRRRPLRRNAEGDFDRPDSSLPLGCEVRPLNRHVRDPDHLRGDLHFLLGLGLLQLQISLRLSPTSSRGVGMI